MPAERAATGEDQTPGIVAQVRLVRLPVVETAVGTVRPVHETAIGAKLLARVVEVNLKAGQVVDAGEVLVRLDDVDLRARRRQSEAALNAAEAARTQAEADANRSASLSRILITLSLTEISSFVCLMTVCLTQSASVESARQ